MKNTHEGKITISRYNGGRRGSGISISVTDENSACEVIEIDISKEDFAEALFGAGYQPCEFEIRVTHLGKKREHKQVEVPFDYTKNDKKNAKATLAPFEIDGWVGSVSDYLNHHRTKNKPDGTVVRSVTFERWVAPE